MTDPRAELYRSASEMAERRGYPVLAILLSNEAVIVERPEFMRFKEGIREEKIRS